MQQLKKKKPNLVLPSFALQSSSTTGWGCHQIRSQVSPCSEGFSSLGRWKCGHDSRVMLQGQQRGGGQLEWGKDPCMLRLRPRKAAQCLCARCRNPSSNQGITAARAAWVLNKQKAVSQVPAPSGAEDLPWTGPQAATRVLPKGGRGARDRVRDPTLGVAVVQWQCVIRR